MFVGASLSSWRIANPTYVGEQILWYCQLSLVLILSTLPMKPVLNSLVVQKTIFSNKKII
jgi:hypothetical protein